jgi:hypothetical protein
LSKSNDQIRMNKIQMTKIVRRNEIG